MENGVLVDIRTVQLLCSRLCHDLAGPAGAVHNGMELLQETAAGDNVATALIAASIGQLNGRLGFYRMAFGLGGLSGRKPALGEARDLAAAMLKGGRVELDWPLDPGVDDSLAGRKTTDGAIKLLLNMVLFGIGALPRGGSIRVTVAAAGPAAVGLMVNACGKGVLVKDDIIAALTMDAGDGDAEATLSAHNVQGFFMRRLAQSLGGDIEVSAAADEVKVTSMVSV